MSNVDKFIAKRPYYVREHVNSIAALMIVERIPFCEQCCDWHMDDEICSE